MEGSLTSESRRKPRKNRRELALSMEAYPWTRRFLISLLGGFSRFLFRPRYEGLENLPAKGPYFLCGNHLSLFDVMVTHPMAPQHVNWLAKSSLFSLPVIGECVRRLGAIPIDRGKADLAAIKTVLSSLRTEAVIGIFPQGTRVPHERREEILPKPGLVALLARGQVPIIPFLIIGPYRFFRPLRVAFGPAFVLNLPPQSRAMKEQEEILSRELMRRIYSLGDEPFPDEKDPEAAMARLREMSVPGQRLREKT